ncbi:hypothetical protein [Zavarzinella formosa]|uniref:hypothetical protein n=1 Tax=Zavarzinella formosa TaxID=360055 RepID=UPI00030FF69E|nr:hypothetical protein [Zavarzinella formosa]
MKKTIPPIYAFIGRRRFSWKSVDNATRFDSISINIPAHRITTLPTTTPTKLVDKRTSPPSLVDAEMVGDAPLTTLAIVERKWNL